MGRRETPITYGKRMLLLTVCYDLGAVDNSISEFDISPDTLCRGVFTLSKLVCVCLFVLFLYLIVTI